VPPVNTATYRPIYPATSGSVGNDQETVAENLDAMLEEVHDGFDPPAGAARGWAARRLPLHPRPADENQARPAVGDHSSTNSCSCSLAWASPGASEPASSLAPVMRDRQAPRRAHSANRFPFTLTRPAERRLADRPRPGQRAAENRLLPGDVGSGKTVVALYAMLLGVANKLQAALLAPTEVLAEQHFLTLGRALQGSSVTLELFTGRTKNKTGRRMKDLADGQNHLAVGTQALIQQDVEFANLGLVVVDRSSKLGVKQRGPVLKGKGAGARPLSGMTARPIPRTLALSYFADFDVTTIDELPPGRQPIETRWLRPHQAIRGLPVPAQAESPPGAGLHRRPQIDDDGLDDSKSVTASTTASPKAPSPAFVSPPCHGQLTTEEKQKS